MKYHALAAYSGLATLTITCLFIVHVADRSAFTILEVEPFAGTPLSSVSFVITYNDDLERAGDHMGIETTLCASDHSAVHPQNFCDSSVLRRQ